MKAIDLTGKRFGLLTVTARAPSDNAGKAQWFCRCQCGTEVVVRAQALRSGATRTCGCGLSGALTPANSVDMSPRFTIIALDGPQLGVMRTAYGFCHVTRVSDGEVLFTADPVARQYVKGEPSAAASRGMSWLAQHGHIQPRSGRSWLRWLRDERVEVKGAESNDKGDVVRQWEVLTGRVHESNVVQPLSPIQGARAPLPSTDSQDDRDAVLDAVHRMLTDDGTPPVMDDATKRESMLADARRGGADALEVARRRIDRTKH